MKIYHFLLVWLFLSISLSPQSLTATTPVLDKLLEMYQRQATQPISPAELQQELARTGLDQLWLADTFIARMLSVHFAFFLPFDELVTAATEHLVIPNN